MGVENVNHTRSLHVRTIFESLCKWNSLAKYRVVCKMILEVLMYNLEKAGFKNARVPNVKAGFLLTGCINISYRPDKLVVFTALSLRSHAS